MTAADIALKRSADNIDDIIFRDGDFILSPSDEQHIQDIVESFPGWWKEFILIGVGIKSYINSSGKEQEIQGNIALQLRSDGYQVPSVDVNYDNAGTLTIATDAVRS